MRTRFAQIVAECSAFADIVALPEVSATDVMFLHATRAMKCALRAGLWDGVAIRFFVSCYGGVRNKKYLQVTSG